MPLFNVSAKKEHELLERMHQLSVSESDIEEKFVRSSGPGGQKINKTSSCVFLHHIPTGIKVKCHKDRSQSINRFLARRLLLDQIERMKKGFVSEERKMIEKKRNQKRRRSKRAKDKIKKSKHKQPENRE